MKVCSFSRELMLQILSISLQNGIRFLHYPLPAFSSAFLAVCLPYRRKYRLTLFLLSYNSGLGDFSIPVICVHPEMKNVTLPFGRSLSASLAL